MGKSKIGNYLLVIALMLFCGYVGSEIQKRHKDTKEVIKYVKTIEKRIDTVYQERIVYEEKNKWIEKQREKLKEKKVKDFIKKNPEKTPTQIARELGVSRPTVYKYLKELK